MQELKRRCLRAFVRFKQSAFARKGTLALVALTLAAGDVMAGSKGAAGFTKATQEVSSYRFNACCKAMFRLAAPTIPRCMDVSTWMSAVFR